MPVFRQHVEFTTPGGNGTLDMQITVDRRLTWICAKWHALCIKAGDAQPN